ncbi:MAG: S-methyl-5-thioribose-1-phosphate isomerase [Gemmatimonadetes bacterium]|jgi:methylthioribose-1-phosphate isomerase|nr:S-methyl-5-thioribose-1-phosphate isomerase [Gemmatimonadota bacterium]MCC7324196.1 S-methyl-5-thioribose-1-phosphate isomerase [Gemmatimonadaceae bacterium]MBK6458707.1 S-methyl-5-thioribose-1-phosphate isomerase [Gemmatimonadota bacterium]MBK6843742.1 S-methyl-5-thioribose-1-phosphate isomerase [Gemmatimonadota bacterium]MBK7833164.1 S-methyl-5-thioribose-1-phosphate isomerase [Gemmatimonadota bacterium]
MQIIEAVRWSPSGDAVRIIDQRLLPAEYVERDLRAEDEVCDAIRTLAVRGAPAIGICGAMGLVTTIAPHVGEGEVAFRERLRAVAWRIREARPTAVNLAWGIDRMLRRAAAVSGSNAELLEALREEATVILAEDRAMCEAIGAHGVTLLAEGARVLTHCNAGALATGGIGTALAPVYHAARAGRRVAVYADETRPLLQGSRLTAWELSRAGIPVTVIADNMAASLMAMGAIDVVIVGADRIAANGDVANKIGTYGVAVLAHHHGIPFYVAAPSSTIDPATPTGREIVIEQRAREEVIRGFGPETAPVGVSVCNPAFDVTPAALVTGIVTDRGIVRGPYAFGAEWASGGGASV